MSGSRLAYPPGGSGSGTTLPETCEGRITTESGVPVSTSDRTSQGSIYFTPSTIGGKATTNGNITLYNGSALVNVAFTEFTLALTLTSGKNYDVFVDYNSGIIQLVLSAAWTNDTTRADALGVQSGIIIKSGTPAYRWVGTIRASGTNITEDSLANRLIWSACNQVPRGLYKTDATSHTYNGGYRQWNNTATNRLQLVVGLPQSGMFGLSAETATASGGFSINAAGLDSTSAFYRGLFAYAQGTALILNVSAGAPSEVEIPLGYHAINALESTASGSTGTFADFFLSGLMLI